MIFFSNVNTIEELKKLYRNLAFKFHPDNGGSKEDMQKLNAEYDILFQQLKNIHIDDIKTTDMAETPEMFRNIINKIIMLNINIDIVGSWIWVTGNTYPHKDALKEAGFKWGGKKKAWYWYPPEAASNNRKSMTLDEIKKLHGCKNVRQTKVLTA